MFALISSRSGSQSAMLLRWALQGHYGPLVFCIMDFGLTLVLLNPDMSCLCKQCRSRSVGFWRSQLIWICTVCHEVSEFISTILIKQSDRLKMRIGHGILIYSATRAKGPTDIYHSFVQSEISEWHQSSYIFLFLYLVCLSDYYCNNPSYWDRQAWASSVDPEQMLQNVASDQGLHSMPFIQQFLDTSTGSWMNIQILGQVWSGDKVPQYLG